MKKKIKLIFILTIMILIGCTYLPNYALANEITEENDNVLEERYTYINNAQSILSITSGRLDIKSKMTAKLGINCELNKSIAVSKGYEYRNFFYSKSLQGI